MSFSSILFMPEGDDRSFHENLISELCLFIVIYLRVTFKYQRVTYVRTTTNSVTVRVQLSHPRFNRKTLYQHRKRVYTSFNEV